jgi:hypothetical protein
MSTENHSPNCPGCATCRGEIRNLKGKPYEPFGTPPETYNIALSRAAQAHDATVPAGVDPLNGYAVGLARRRAQEGR